MKTYKAKIEIEASYDLNREEEKSLCRALEIAIEQCRLKSIKCDVMK